MTGIFKEETHQIGQIVFESLRNTGACAAVAIAGGVVLHNPEISIIGRPYYAVLAFGLISIASVLLIFNMMLSIDKVLAKAPPKSRWIWPIYVVVTPIFVISTLSVLGAQAKLTVRGEPKQPAVLHESSGN